MKKIISCALCLSLLCSMLPIRAENTVIEEKAEYVMLSENSVYTFGNEFNEIKAWDTNTLSETAIGTTGFKVSTSANSYNNVVIRNNESTHTGYFLAGTGLPDNGYYMFLGAGSKSTVDVTLTLPETVPEGKYIKVTYAKPYARNDGSTSKRNEVNNECSIIVGEETADAQTVCEFDKWYTTVFKANTDIASISAKLGNWSALAISSVEICDSADMLSITQDEGVTSKYITSETQTVKYSGKVYNSLTTEMNKTEILALGTVNTDALINYSVNGYEGVSIDETGSLSITPSASAGTVTVSAEYGGITKSMQLELLQESNADTVKIIGDELIEKGQSLALKAIPMAGIEYLPERPTEWSIEGDAHGCTIENGVLTVPENATPGNITVKAELKVEGIQTEAGVFDTMTVTIRDDAVISPYEIKGVFFKNCTPNIADAKGVDGIAVDTSAVSQGYRLIVKAVDENGMITAEKMVSLDNAKAGIGEVKVNMEFDSASVVKAYVLNSDGVIVSSEICKAVEGMYKNVPLVSDWLTGEKSGLGMGSSIMSPTGQPYGVDSDLVDISELNVKYSYDENYAYPTSDNVLWYKEGAYLAKGRSNTNNSIYSRDAADWEEEALPIGNGYMGAMLFGLPDKDQIQINEETFWAAGYRGTQTEVNSNTVNANMSESKNGYMSVGNVFVDFNMPQNATVNNYYRDLNLDESVAHVSYEYDGKKYNREYFASYPKEVVAIRYTGENLSFDVNPVSMHPGDVTANDGEITIIGKLKDSEPYTKGGNVSWSQESDLEYCTKIKVIADDGTVIDGYNTVTVSGATGVTILVAAATDYDKDQFELNADGSVNMDKTPYKSVNGVQAAIDKATARINGAAAVSYDELKAEHIADYKSQFDTVKFSLTGDEICTTPTNELQNSYKNAVKTTTNADDTTSVSYDETTYKNLDKHLEELHYNYARYMMISSSRSDTMPATLQGKWCQSVAEIWGSCYCININMEMNYWFAGGANLLDSGKSLVTWFNSQIPAGRVTAKNMYKVTPKSYTYADGKITFADSTDDKDDVFIMHTKQAIMGTTDMTGSTSIQSPGNTAWLMYNLWDLYQTTGDKELLSNELYPIMRKPAKKKSIGK